MGHMYEDIPSLGDYMIIYVNERLEPTKHEMGFLAWRAATTAIHVYFVRSREAARREAFGMCGRISGQTQKG